MKIMNEHASIVQSYFQKRVVNWMETVGKKIFGIDHYWIRYEFAPSRGQIHAHFLAICRDKQVLHDMHHFRKDVKKQAKLLVEYAEKKIGLTKNIQEPPDPNAKMREINRKTSLI